MLSTTQPMGIRGLNTCLSKTVPHVFTDLDWAEMRGCRVGVDIQCFMYRALSNHIRPIEMIVSQIMCFRELGVLPLYVFDGPPPAEKESVVAKRRDDRREAAAKIQALRLRMESATQEQIPAIEQEIHELESKHPQLTYEMKDEIKLLFNTLNIQYVNSASEADTVLAHLFRREAIDYVASFDMDFLARGVKLLIPKQIGYNPGNRWVLLDPDTIRQELRLTDLQFLDLCVLMGSDYTPNLPIVPWNIALTSLQRRLSLEEIWSRHTFSNWRKTGVEAKTVKELTQLKAARDILSGLEDRPDIIIDTIQLTQAERV